MQGIGVSSKHRILNERVDTTLDMEPAHPGLVSLNYTDSLEAVVQVKRVWHWAVAENIFSFSSNSKSAVVPTLWYGIVSYRTIPYHTYHMWQWIILPSGEGSPTTENRHDRRHFAYYSERPPIQRHTDKAPSAVLVSYYPFHAYILIRTFHDDWSFFLPGGNT